MAGIKQPLVDVLTRLKTLTFATNESSELKPVYVRVWNNQKAYDKDGQLYAYPKPAIFVEIINNVSYTELGKGMQSADLGWRLHIIHEYYNDANDKTFDEDLIVFDLRDKVRTLMNLFEPTACGPMVVTAEQQDFEHDNIYEYIVEFVCNFTDSTGSPLNTGSGNYIDSTPPIGLQATVVLVDSIPGSENKDNNQHYKIPK